MEDLPLEVMVDILSRLPMKMITQCKCVCKKWQNIVLDSYFVDLQLSRSSAGFMIYHNSKLEFHNFEEDELDHHHLHHDPVMSLDLELVPIFRDSQIFLMGSVNGLLCLWQSGQGKDNTFICNPITREYMSLPKQQYRRGSDAFTTCCFGFGPLTREYKVIRIFQGYIPPNHISGSQWGLVEAEVYTIGTGQWRSLGRVPYRHCKYYYGPFLNGHAHWTLFDKDSPESICTFDFDKEIFELFPSPPSNQRWIFISLGILKGCLCRCESYYNKTTIWVMKEYGIKKSWHKELVIREGISPDLYMTLLLKPVYVISGFKYGTILMGSNGDTPSLFVYCPRRKTIVKTHIFYPGFKGYAYHPNFHRLQNSENERVDVF